MANLLVLYGSNYGQTRKVAERIADVARGRGHEVSIVPGNAVPPDFDPAAFDAAFIGTSIEMDIHQRSVKKLVKEHRSAFARIPCAYFMVCLTAVSPKPEDRQKMDKYVDDFTGYTGLDPAAVGVFAGALRYPEYNLVRRFMVKLVARRLGANTDTGGEYEYTDWPAVNRFAEEFLDSLGGAGGGFRGRKAPE